MPQFHCLQALRLPPLQDEQAHQTHTEGGGGSSGILPFVKVGACQTARSPPAAADVCGWPTAAPSGAKSLLSATPKQAGRMFVQHCLHSTVTTSLRHCGGRTFGRVVSIRQGRCGHSSCHHRLPKARARPQEARLQRRRHCRLPCSRRCVAGREAKAAVLLLLRWCQYGCCGAKPKGIGPAGGGRSKACRGCCCRAAKGRVSCQRAEGIGSQAAVEAWHTGGRGPKGPCWLCCLPKDDP